MEMLRRIVRASWLIAMLLTAGFALAQTEFSAEMFDLQKGETSNAKIYFGKDKLRIEPTKKDPHGGGAVIMNISTQTTTILMDAQHTYMEVPQQMAGQRNPYAYNFFRTGNVEAACSDWAQQTHNNGTSCHKVGSDTVNGRSCVKYEGTNQKGETTTFWIDPKLRFPIKGQGKNSNWELRNIQEGSQPASLFEVPADYKKFEMPNMPNMGGMQRPQ
jgi:hypothetical protein